MAPSMKPQLPAQHMECHGLFCTMLRVVSNMEHYGTRMNLVLHSCKWLGSRKLTVNPLMSFSEHLCHSYMKKQIALTQQNPTASNLHCIPVNTLLVEAQSVPRVQPYPKISDDTMRYLMNISEHHISMNFIYSI